MRSNSMTAVTADISGVAAAPVPPSRASCLTVACAVCGSEFSARRAEAKCCSGRCRITLSRTRRVADLVTRLATVEAAMAAVEATVNDARTALRDLRTLAQQGGAKVAP